MLSLARILSTRATCPKLAVGCVLADAKNNIVGTGYNGVPYGLPHCTEHPCNGADKPEGSDSCIAVHAEQNALMRCRDVEDIATAYITHFPCLRCTKMLLNTPCARIVAISDEPLSTSARNLWISAGRIWERYEEA
jgi:dCMP deaminase